VDCASDLLPVATWVQCQLGEGPFYKEQHVVPPVVYLAAYMLALPLLVYLPTHWVLAIWDRSRDRK
jgi:hypothetical protein